MTSSPGNVYPGGNGYLDITARAAATVAAVRRLRRRICKMREITLSASSTESKRSTLMALCVALLLLVTGALIAVNLVQPAAYAAAASTAVTTYRNDNGRTGQYPTETVLNTSNVNVSQFGKRVSYPVDGQLYAQPLYVPNLTIGGSVHNVVFAATENDSVYAFDADATSAGAPLWKTSLLPGGATAGPYSAVSCGDLPPIIGITGTPVIDPTTNTMYVVNYDDEGRQSCLPLACAEYPDRAGHKPAHRHTSISTGDGRRELRRHGQLQCRSQSAARRARTLERESLYRLLLVL